MTRRAVLLISLLVTVTGANSHAQNAATPREPSDVFIRRAAGLPTQWERGHIEILDVGHHAMETMISIVAHRTPKGWSVTYACAQSPKCAPGQNHIARHYVLRAQDGDAVDKIVSQLKSGEKPGGAEPQPGLIGGSQRVLINIDGFSREFRRIGDFGPLLGGLEALLSQEPPGG